MQLISDIINDLVSNQISLTVALNKTKVLATRIGNTGLLEWVNLELTGYQDDELIPSYRKTNGTVKGDFINGMQRGSNFPIQLEVGDENNRKLREFKFSQGIAILEGFLISSKKGTLLYQYPESLMRSIQGLLQNTNGPYFQLTRIGVEVPANFATEVISVVKSKLLDFILTLETEFGIETEINDLKKNNKKVTYIMNNTINTSGDGNVITTGEKAIVTATINITKGNKEQLVQTLKDNNIQEEDINALLDVIDIESSTTNAFGTKVNSWIQKMLAKSLEGSWQIGIGAAGTLLADVIKGYYGI